MAYQTNGAPICVFQVKVDNVTGTNWYDARIYYYYATWTGTNWQKQFIAQAGRPLYDGQPDYGGGICLDVQNPNTIYLSSDAANPFDLSSTTNVALGANYEIWKGVTTNGGLTFAWQPITAGSTVDNLRPYVPRVFGGEPCVLWFRGSYTSYTSFNCSIVGLFTTAVPQTNSASGTWIVDADGQWGAAANWANAIIASGAGNTADFSTLDITSNRTVTLDTSRTIGTLRFGDPAGNQNWTLESSGGSVLTIASGLPSIVVNQNTATLALSLSGTNGFTKSGPGTLVLAGSNLLSGTLNLDSGSTSANDGAVQIASSAALANVASPITFRDNTGPNAVATLQLNGSNGGLLVTQNFSTTCRNNNTTPTFESLAGTNTLSGANLVQVGGTNVIYQSDAGSLLLVTAPMQYVGTLTAARFFTFTGEGNVTVTGPILAASNNITPIAVIKAGHGTLTLAGANTYTNGTVVSGGTLLINGSPGIGRVNVTAGTLGGTGVIGGPVSISSSGTLAPGTSAIGTLSINNTLANAGVTVIKFDKTGSMVTNDSVNGVTTLTFGGTLDTTNVGTGILTAGDSLKIFSATSYQGAFATISPATPGIGLVWNTNNLTTSGTLAVALGAILPRFGPVTLNGTNLIVSGFGGAAGYNYSVLFSTNLTLPLTNWNILSTAAFDRLGDFGFTNHIEPQAQQQYFMIHLP
jgi:autotransporter-associated beta strand protein